MPGNLARGRLRVLPGEAAPRALGSIAVGSAPPCEADPDETPLAGAHPQDFRLRDPVRSGMGGGRALQGPHQGPGRVGATGQVCPVHALSSDPHRPGPCPPLGNSRRLARPSRPLAGFRAGRRSRSLLGAHLRAGRAEGLPRGSPGETDGFFPQAPPVPWSPQERAAPCRGRMRSGC